MGVAICEEAWHAPVIARLAAEDAELIVVVNASPYTRSKHTGERLRLMRRRVRESGLPLIYVNLVGGQDELVYDGASFALDREGRLIAALPAFDEAEAVLIIDGWSERSGPGGRPYPEGDAADYAAMLCGLRDYVAKNRLPGVVYGNSGGLDSALTARWRPTRSERIGCSRSRCRRA